MKSSELNRISQAEYFLRNNLTSSKIEGLNFEAQVRKQLFRTDLHLFERRRRDLLLEGQLVLVHGRRRRLVVVAGQGAARGQLPEDEAASVDVDAEERVLGEVDGALTSTF